jgi:GTP-binding protein
MIRHELEQYSPALAARPELVVVTKVDLTGAKEAQQEIARELGGEVLAISAVTGQGIPVLLHAIDERLKQRSEPSSEVDAPEEATVPAGGQ